MILRYPNSSSATNCFSPASQFESPFPTIMNSNSNNCSRLSFIHHHHSEISTQELSENNSSTTATLMSDEPCTPCSTWLSLTSLNQLSFNTSSTSDSSCTISIESQLMPPPPPQSSSTTFQTSSSSINTSAKDLFDEEFRLKCNKYRKINEATKSISSLTPCSVSSSSPPTSENSTSPTLEKTNDQSLNSAAATIVSKVLSSVLSKSMELKQKKIQKRSGFKRQDMPKLVIPTEQSSIFIKHCSLTGKKK